LGFLSGIAYESTDGENPMNGLDAEAVWAWIDNYCQAHPLEQIVTAGQQFVFVHPR
jgi:hypothetical protein